MTHRTVTNVLGKSMAITSPIAIPNSANPTTRFIFIDPSLIMYLTLFYASHRPDITDNYCNLRCQEYPSHHSRQVLNLYLL